MNTGTLSGFGGRLAAGGAVTTQIINAHSSGGTSTTGMAAAALFGTREVLSGALSANVLATALTVTGSGRVPALSVYAKDATARTARLVVEVDGVTVFNATSSSLSVANQGIFAAGIGDSGGLQHGEPIVFGSSLVVKIASSLTETDKLAIAYLLHRT